MPCWVRKWNLTHRRSLLALIIENVWLPNKCMWRNDLGIPRSDIPIVVRASHPGSRVALDGMVQIRKSQGIAEEEHWGIVAHNVPVAILGVELERGSADVALSIGGATLAGDGREARKHRRLLADLAEYLGPGIASNVARDREGPVRAPAFCMHAAFWNDFSVEVRELLNQPDVL